jgi:hypothetical protein
MSNGYFYHGFVPPSHLYRNRRFAGVALEPPDYMPGSWIGAGKAWYDAEADAYFLTARPRTAAEGVRGYSGQVFRSENGIDFHMIAEVTKEQAADISGVALHSIEGTQLLRDPSTGIWLFYLSVDTGDAFVWGGVKWETIILSAHALSGPWTYEGFAFRNDQDYDAHQARDATIDIVDGRWVAIYKAKNAERNERPGFATSLDGIAWRKHGTLTTDGEDALGFLSGSFFPTSSGLMFVGLRTRLIDSNEEREDVVYADSYGIGHGGGPTPLFVAYLVDTRSMNLETVYSTPWVPLSPYERDDHPLLGYSSTAIDRARRRAFFYTEAIDPELTEAIGINSTVERLLVYEMTW